MAALADASAAIRYIPPPKPGMISGRQYADYRFSDMENEYSTWLPHYQDLTVNFAPRKGRYNVTDVNKGNRRNTLVNNAPLYAKRVLMAGMMSGITSQSRPWFRLGLEDADRANFGPIRIWLDIVERVMYRVFASSNFYKQMPNVYEDLGIYGTNAMIQEADFENLTRFTSFENGEYRLAINGKGQVDTFGREYQLKTLQMVQNFGYQNCSTRVQNAYDQSQYGTPFTVRQLIEPAKEDDLAEFVLPDKFQSRSIYYELGGTQGVGREGFLRIKGYNEFPITAPRWQVRNNDTYGTSPGMEALGDARGLQVGEREKAKAIAKMVNPPMRAPTSMQSKAAGVIPGFMNFSDDPDQAFKPLYQVNPQINELGQDLRLTEERVNRAFFVDLFLRIMSDDRLQRATATEIVAVEGEKLLMLGPVLESVHGEALDPIIGRLFNQMVELSMPGWRGLTDRMVIPPPPPEMGDGAELKIDYISLLAQAQRQVNTAGVQAWIGMGAQMAEIGLPNALDKVNEDAVMDVLAEDYGVPSNLINSDEKIKDTREARAAEVAAAQQQAGAANMAGTMKTMSETPIGGGDTALSAVSDQMSGAQ